MKCLVFLACLTAASAGAQSAASVFQKAPPAQDEALRKNINTFYQAHVDGKTRQAMNLVAEEAADAFFDMQKPKFLSFEVQQVTYAKEFTHARVMVLAEREVAVPFGGTQVMKIPLESYWKQVDSQWRWYIPRSDCKDTPFGCVPTTGAAADPAAAKKIQEEISRIKAGQFGGEMGLDKTILEMSSGGEAEVTFKNGMDGYLSLKFVQPFQDAEVELVNAEQQVKPKSTVKFTVRVKKDVKIAQAREVIVPLYIEPFHRLVGLRIHLKP